MAVAVDNPADSIMVMAPNGGGAMGAAYVAAAGSGGQIIPSGEPNM